MLRAQDRLFEEYVAHQEYISGAKPEAARNVERALSDRTALVDALEDAALYGSPDGLSLGEVIDMIRYLSGIILSDEIDPDGYLRADLLSINEMIDHLEDIG